MDSSDLVETVRATLTDPALGYDQKLRRLAGHAVSVMPYPELSEACRAALDARVICDMYEGNRPYTPRYVLPDYGQALSRGLEALEVPAPTDLAEALSLLTIMYAHVPSVTTYPVYLGDLDTLLEPFAAGVDDESLERALRLWYRQLDRLLPDAFVHANLGPADSRVARTLLRLDRELKQVVPNLTLKVSAETPDDLVTDAVRTMLVTGKPHFAHHEMMTSDLGPQYAVVSCYNSLKVGGGAHTLVRLNLRRVVESAPGADLSTVLDDVLPHYVDLTSELIAARIRSLVEEQRFFETHWLAREGLVHLDRFSAMFGIFGLAEAVAELQQRAGRSGEWGHDVAANAVGYQLVARLAELVAAKHLPYCEGGGGRAFLHAQSGIDLDTDVTAGTRVPIGHEPALLQHLEAVAPVQHWFSSGVSDIVHIESTVERNPQAVVDLIRGGFRRGMRDMTLNVPDNEFIRITGYLVRKSDLETIERSGARHASDYLAAGAEASQHMTTRRVQRVGAAEARA